MLNHKKKGLKTIYEHQPKTSSLKALYSWQSLETLKIVDVYKSVLEDFPEIAREFEAYLEGNRLEYKENWKNEWGFVSTGTRKKNSNEIYGFGQRVCQSGKIQEGFCIEGWFYGKVKLVYSNGSAYIGPWQDFKKHGYGIFYDEDGSQE